MSCHKQMPSYNLCMRDTSFHYYQVLLSSFSIVNVVHMSVKSGPEVKKKISCSTQLSMRFFLLINVKMPTFVGILTFISRKISILGFSVSEIC